MPWPINQAGVNAGAEEMIYRVGHDSDYQFVRVAIINFVEMHRDPDYRVEIESMDRRRMCVRTFFHGEKIREFHLEVKHLCEEKAA